MKTPSQWAEKWHKECFELCKLEQSISFEHMTQTVATIIHQATEEAMNEGIKIGFDACIENIDKFSAHLKDIKNKEAWKQGEK